VNFAKTRRGLPGSRAARRERQVLWLMLLPFLGAALALVALPAGLVALRSMQYISADGLEWAGLANYQRVVADPAFVVALTNTAVYLVLTVPFKLLAALALALALARPRRGVPLWRAAIYLPSVVPAVAYALVWLWWLNPQDGPLNRMLRGIGAPAFTGVAAPDTALPSLALASIFQLGEAFVVLLAGALAIPREVGDAARLEGAGEWARLRFIVLPLLTPWLVLATVRELIVAVQASFTPALVMTGGGPGQATLLLPQYLVRLAIDHRDLGAAAALACLDLAVLALVLALLAWRSRGWRDVLDR